MRRSSASFRRWPRLAACVAAVVATSAAACGKKAAPLPPIVRVPVAPTTLTAERIDEDVYVQFALPTQNVGGDSPADLGRVEVWAFTTDGPIDGVDPVKVGQLVATVTAQPPPPPPPPVQPGAPPPPPPPVLPGVPQGATAYVTRALTPGDRAAVTLPAPRGTARRSQAPEPLTILMPPPARVLRRYYTAVPVSPRGRRGAAAVAVGVPLDRVAGAPPTPEVTYTESQFEIRWTAPADARLETVTPPGLLRAIPLWETPVPTRYQVYQVDAPGTVPGTVPIAETATSGTVPGTVPPQTAPPRDPAQRPAALSATLLTDTQLTVPGVVFGAPRCFVVRAVDVIDGTTVEGPASPPRCVTPRDTFAPKPPKSLAAVAGPGAVNLIWDPNDEADLAGYLVLRGEVGRGELQPLTPAPIAETTYRDTAVRVGVRYVYAVVAVDRATPANRSALSDRVEDTARQ